MVTNLADAALVAARLALDPTNGLEGCLPMLVPKSMWEVNQIIGTYDLIYPWMHIDYPTRLEVQKEIQNTMNNHVGSFGHNGVGDSTTSQAPPVPPAEFIPNETLAGETLYVRASSPVNAVGYGVGDENLPEGAAV